MNQNYSIFISMNIFLQWPKHSSLALFINSHSSTMWWWFRIYFKKSKYFLWLLKTIRHCSNTDDVVILVLIIITGVEICVKNQIRVWWHPRGQRSHDSIPLGGSAKSAIQYSNGIYWSSLFYGRMVLGSYL